MLRDNAPLGLLIKLALVVLGVELSIMWAIDGIFIPAFGPDVPSLFWEFLDPLLLILMVAPVLYVSVLRPMREQHLQLAESEQRYRIAFATSPDPMAITRQKDGCVLDINDSYLRLAGWTRDQIIGKTPLELPLWRNPGDRERLLETLLNKGYCENLEISLPGKNGREITVLTSARLFAMQDEPCIFSVGRDITERKAAEEQLRKLSLAVEQSPESIVITNLAAEIEYVNQAFVHNTGYSRAEAIGQNPRILKSGKTPPETSASLWNALTNGQPWKGEFCNRRKDGSEYIEFATVTPIHQPDGRITHYVAVKEDITEKKRLGEELDRHRHHLEELVQSRTVELAEARNAAEAANRAKSSFLANMSHEIRTPMNGILGMAHILRREGVTPRQAERLDSIGTSAQHLLSIINDILDISKIEAGKMVLEEEPVNLASILNNIRSILSERAKAKDIRLLVEAESLPADLLGDSTRLQQALLNYAANAVKFTAQGSVTLRCFPLHEDAASVLIRFEVEDTGIGIPSEAIPRLFSAFEQADPSTTRKYGGTGLGLAITRRLAELMNGEVGIESSPGAGSTFWFAARLKKGGEARQAAPAVNADAEAIIRQAYHGQRILVVDDEPINREIAQIQLEAAGLAVDSAEDGAEAIAMAQDMSYAAILMDMQMPNVDGLEATRQIRELPGYRQTPIIAMTANAFAEDKARCFEAGMDDFLVKPFIPDMLFTMLLKWLGQRHV